MDLMDLFIKVDVEDKASDKLSTLANKTETLANKIGNGLETAAKIGTAAVTVASGAVTALVKTSISAYAEYEQLVGGIDTLFKGSSQKLQQYAAEAYKTAGVSANDYMSMATSFAASLISSLSETVNESELMTVEAVEDARDAQLEIVKRSAEESVKILKEAQEEEVWAFEKATDEKIALINRQYSESIKLIDEEAYRQIQAIEEQIDAINAQTSAERKAIEEREQAQKIAALREKVDAAKTDEEKKKASENLADYLADIEQKRIEEERKAQIEALKAEKDAIKDKATEEKNAAKEARDAAIDEIEEASAEQKRALKKAQQEELELLEEYNEQKKASTTAYYKTMAEMAENTQAITVASAETYSLAAEMADMAIKDMSDNANKLGTDLSMIQSAYQGFAKQNYTMLDNLKLGYGGTKSEMFRLIEDANAIKEANGEMADLSIERFADIVEAIHIIQEEMDITGTTSKEASTTISGSVLSMKAAWENLLVAIADENQDFGAKMDEFVETIVGTTNESGEAVGGVINNILPRVEIALNGVGALVTTALPKIMEYVPGIITDFLPKIVTAGAGIVRSLGEGIYDNKDEILDLFFGMVDSALGILKNGDGITNFLGAGVGIIADIMEGITESIPDMVDAALGIVEGFVGFLSDTRNIDKILWGAISIVTELVNAITDPATLERLFTAAVSIVSSLMEYLLDPQNLGEIAATVFALIEALATGIINAVFGLAEAAFELRGTLTEYIGDPEWWAGVGQEIAGSIGRGLMTSPLSAIFGGIGGSFGMGASAITDYFNDVANATAETDEAGVGDGLAPSLYGSDAIGTQRFGGGTVNNNSDTTNNTVGDVTMNIYAPEVSVEELEEIMARAVNGVLSR